MSSSGIPGFDTSRVETSWGGVHLQSGGAGDVVVLLHGFPESSLMWREVAPILAETFRVIAVDLPGYGRSDPPRGRGMSKREMASTIHEAVGVDRYALVGHDRGGRVAYRAALDRPEAIRAVAMLDVIPTSEVWERADDRLTLAFWPFSLLAQPSPLPERLIAADPSAVVDDALSNWGSPAATFPADLRAAYIHALRDPDRVHAICDDYRAAAGVDRELDLADWEAGRRITASLLCLWSATGALGSWYEDADGPLGIWRRWADDVQGRSVDAGHFFPEELPEQTAGLIAQFLRSRSEV